MLLWSIGRCLAQKSKLCSLSKLINLKLKEQDNIRSRGLRSQIISNIEHFQMTGAGDYPQTGNSLDTCHSVHKMI